MILGILGSPTGSPFTNMVVIDVVTYVGLILPTLKCYSTAIPQ